MSLRNVPFFVLSLLWIGGVVTAGTFTWDGGNFLNDKWAAGLNWEGDVAPPKDGTAFLVFPSDVDDTDSDMDDNWSVYSLEFSAGTNDKSYFISSSTSSTLEITGGDIQNNSSKLQEFFVDIVLAGNQCFGTGAGGMQFDKVIELGNNELELLVGTSGMMIFNNDISGLGSLTKTGFGEVHLAGQNSYVGPTTIENGTLRVVSAGSLADTCDVIVHGSGYFAVDIASDTIGSLSGSGPVALGNSTINIGGDDGSSTFSGAISGSGNLGKVGAGVVTLTGSNTYTGATTIQGGTLRLDGSGQLSDETDVTVSSTATLRLDGTAVIIDSLDGDGSVELFGGSSVLRVGHHNGSGLFSGEISGAGGLVQVACPRVGNQFLC